MRYIILALAVSVLLPSAVTGQDQAANTGSSAASQDTSAKEQAKGGPPREAMKVRSRANVRVDLTISDQTGSGPVEKKQVTLIAAEESWGKIRTNAATKAQDITAGGGPVTPIRLNVDARPFLNYSGAIQLELTIDYNPLGPMIKDTAQLRPTEINQSMTIVLQSGKPMIVSQAADPVTDRKIIVEVVATILK